MSVLFLNVNFQGNDQLSNVLDNCLDAGKDFPHNKTK